jgi:uncharacterized protein (TIGR03083 family)
MTDAPPYADARLLALVETWRHACESFVALARSLPEETWETPTDLAGWSVKDNVAHTAHLEAVLAGAPEETLEVPPASHVTGPMGYYTEQGVVARRGRTMHELVDELAAAVVTRHDALLRDPPTDAGAPASKTPGDVGWSWATLLGNRPFDVWMHEQDVRRAVGRPGGYDGPAAAHAIGTLGRALPMVVGKRAGAPVGTTVRLVVPEAERDWTVAIGDDGRGGFVDPSEATADVTLRLSSEAFVVLGGGRRDPGAVDVGLEGDEELGRRVLAALAVTP